MKFFADMIAPFGAAEGVMPNRLGPFLGWALRGSGRTFLIALAISVAVGLSEVAGAVLIGWSIDQAQKTGPEFIRIAAFSLIGIALFFVVLRPALMALNAAMQSVALGPNLFSLILSRLFRYTLGQSMRFFDDDFAGRIAQKAQQTARALTDVVLETANIGGFVVASVLGATLIMGSVNWRLGLILLVWVAAYSILIRAFLPRIRDRARAAARAMVTGQVVDTITNITMVKLFSHGAHEDDAAKDALSGFRDAGLEFGAVVVWFRLVLFTLAGLLPTALIGTTLWLWSAGQATAGDIAIAGLLATRLAQMSGWVSHTALGIFANIGEIEDGIRTLSPAHEIVDRPNAIELKRGRGAVAFKNVSFGYGREDRAALDGFDLHIEPGEKVALVGQSGAGKTTAGSLLLRLYEVEGGAVTLDGVDIRDLTQDSLRRQISVVRQETPMFNRPAAENIRYGQIEASDAAVHEAAARASAHDFIQGLQDYRGREGYEAHLGERGVKLSGGQRQRIALARAILKDAPVLVLDEATSALDSEVEAEIQAALNEVMQGKTVIAIAHRLSTIAQMDRIIVLDQGRIAEQGTHDALLEKDGLYARFWSRQSGGFLDLEAAE
ncbi:ABC transporter ATP-binding protein [Halovulum sp. GXIMD14793]